METGQVYLVLADSVLTLHVSIVVFVILGLVAIIAGNLRGWDWVNNRWFRLFHLLAILTVVAEAWLGVTCPLTTLEVWLRQLAGAEGYTGGFIEYWLHRLLYYQAPSWVFTAAYTMFAAVVAATFWWFPPRR